MRKKYIYKARGFREWFPDYFYCVIGHGGIDMWHRIAELVGSLPFFLRMGRRMVGLCRAFCSNRGFVCTLVIDFAINSS